ELELDQVLLDPDLRHHDFLTASDRRPVPLEPARERRVIDRLRQAGIYVDPIVAPRHVELDEHGAPFEGTLELILSLRGHAAGPEQNAENRQSRSHQLPSQDLAHTRTHT